MAYVKKTHRNIQKGDVFYIPLDRDAIYLRDGAGSYFPREDDTVAIAQVADFVEGMLVAIYKSTFLQKEVKEQGFSYLQKNETLSFVRDDYKWFDSRLVALHSKSKNCR